MSWVGDALIEPGRLVYRGQLGSAHRHAHAALQIAVASGGTVAVTDAAGRKQHAASAVLPAGVEHAIDAGRCSGIMVYLEPTGSSGRRVAALLGDHMSNDSREWVRAARRITEVPANIDLSAAADAVVGELVGADEHSAMRIPHPVVRDAVEKLPAMLSGPVRLGDLAGAVHLSADRLGRLFAREVGMSFPAYVRWARLIRAMEVARGGGTITDAAHAAGFSDSAHANRVFHEMFGLAPVEAHRNVRLA